MRILHIIPTLGGGGAERFVVDLVNEQSKEQEVSLCTLYQLDKANHNFFLGEVSSRVNVMSLNKRIGLDLSIYSKIARLVNRLRPDIVHTHLASVNYVLPLAVFNRKIKFFHTIHSDAQFEIKHPLELKSRKWMYQKKFIRPITISKQSQQSFRKLYSLKNDTLIFNGRQVQKPTALLNEVIDAINASKNSESTKVLLHIGRFVEVKRQLLLAQVVDELIKEGHELALFFLGDAETGEGKAIVDAIRHLNNPSIHILGAKKNIIDYLTSADALCISSSNEGLPMSLLEALSVGCVPISTPVGGMVDIISEQIGYLADGLSQANYKKALLEYLTSTTNNEKSNQGVTVFNEHFNIVRTSDKYIQAYASA